MHSNIPFNDIAFYKYVSNNTLHFKQIKRGYIYIESFKKKLLSKLQKCQ